VLTENSIYRGLLSPTVRTPASHAADRLFRNGRAEEKIPAQAGQRRNDRGLLPFGAAGRKRRAEFADARGAEQGRHALYPERAKDVDHQRGFADLYVVFAKADGEKFTAFIVERKFPAANPVTRAQDGDSWEFDDAIFLENCMVPKENVLARNWRGPHCCV